MPSTKITNGIGRYEWHFPGSDDQYVAVCGIAPGVDPNALTLSDFSKGSVSDLFDVTLYDPEVTLDNGTTARDQSLDDLRRLIGLANAAIKHGLEPEAVAEEIKD